uniref:DUF7036 domain-containing protein n=1 Tax=Leersia perrieri TaxID=77586 RepID=A0A0D9VU12_9ORYZ
MGKAAGGRGWWGEGEERGRRRWRWCSAQPWCFRRCSGCPRSRGGAGWRGRTRGVEPIYAPSEALIRIVTDVVASFKLQRMISELNENKPKLEYDIFEEIGIGNSTQSTLQLTPSLFGSSSTFEILRFPGAITIIPPQNAFVAQKPDAMFNFSLNFPIDVVQNKLSELKAQMTSRVAPPTIVQTSVLLAVGTDRKPSLQRLKELAQTLKNSSSGNLGLNHTVFGKVAHIHQVQLLNLIISPHTTHQDNNHDHYSHHHHHHHSHHHHHRHHDLNHQGLQHFPPAPAPLHNIPTFLSFDSSCMLKKLHTDAKRHSVPHMDPSFRHMTPVASPNSYEASGPYADPPSLHPRIPLSPLPAVEFHAMPPSESVETLKHHYNISLWPVVLPLVAHHITCIPVHVTTVEMFLPDGEVPEKLGSPLCKQTQLSNTLDGFFGDPSCKYMYNAAEGDVVVVKAATDIRQVQ